ncbi:MAG: lysoplasmalogenase [Clostridia bacterium]|nr:lysoplasmalogenase [Clostridia bacterium]
MIYVTIALGAVFLIAFIMKCKNERSVGGVFLKNAVSIFFILTAVVGLLSNKTRVEYGALIIVGLVFGMLGDIYLDQKWVYPNDKKSYLYAGFVSFGIGHLFYIPAMVRASGLDLKLLLIPAAAGVVVAVGNLLLEKPMKQNFGEYKAIVTIYGFILAFMAATAVTCAVVTGEKAFVAFAAGGVFFLVSDLILSPMYFGEGKNTPLNFILNHVTYYLGQYLIAVSVILLPELG